MAHVSQQITLPAQVKTLGTPVPMGPDQRALSAYPTGVALLRSVETLDAVAGGNTGQCRIRCELPAGHAYLPFHIALWIYGAANTGNWLHGQYTEYLAETARDTVALNTTEIAYPLTRSTGLFKETWNEQMFTLGGNLGQTALTAGAGAGLGVGMPRVPFFGGGLSNSNNPTVHLEAIGTTDEASIVIVMYFLQYQVEQANNISMWMTAPGG